MRRPGRIVKCKDGKVGRTYNDEKPIGGKVRVYIFANSVQDLCEGIVLDEEEKRVCTPEKLKLLGYAD